jgi:hypothetical protein
MQHIGVRDSGLISALELTRAAYLIENGLQSPMAWAGSLECYMCIAAVGRHLKPCSGNRNLYKAKASRGQILGKTQLEYHGSVCSSVNARFVMTANGDDHDSAAGK